VNPNSREREEVEGREEDKGDNNDGIKGDSCRIRQNPQNLGILIPFLFMREETKDERESCEGRPTVGGEVGKNDGEGDEDEDFL